MKITVLMGGASAERNVSLASGLRIAKALRSRGHEVTAFDPSRGVIGADAERELTEKGVGAAPPSIEALTQTTGGSFLPALEAYPELAKSLPAGEGRKIAADKCAACHDETLIVGQRLDPVRWTREVEKMMRWGSPVTEQEKDVLARYLAEHFR